MLTLLWWALGLFLAGQAAVLLLNVVFFPRLGAHARAGAADGLRLALLIPARNEAAVLPETLPSWQAQHADELLVLNDASVDETAAILAAATGVRVLQGTPLPVGWSGKNWACWQLSQASDADVLVFTDADVVWAPGTLQLVADELIASGAGLLTVWPEQRCETLGERLVVPLVDLLLLANLPHPLVRWLPFPSLAAANGQLMAWRREAYVRVGGHAGLAGEVLEDVRMAQRAKALGIRLTLRLGTPRVRTRMYRGWREVVAGFSKNVLAGAGGSRWGLLLIWVVNLAAFTLPWLLAPFDVRWLALAVLGVALRALANGKCGRPVMEALLQPFGALALGPIVLRALRQRGGYVWKGRVYR